MNADYPDHRPTARELFSAALSLPAGPDPDAWLVQAPGVRGRSCLAGSGMALALGSIGTTISLGALAVGQSCNPHARFLCAMQPAIQCIL